MLLARSIIYLVTKKYRDTASTVHHHVVQQVTWGRKVSNQDEACNRHSGAQKAKSGRDELEQLSTNLESFVFVKVARAMCLPTDDGVPGFKQPHAQQAVSIQTTPLHGNSSPRCSLWCRGCSWHGTSNLARPVGSQLSLWHNRPRDSSREASVFVRDHRRRPVLDAILLDRTHPGSLLQRGPLDVPVCYHRNTTRKRPRPLEFHPLRCGHSGGHWGSWFYRAWIRRRPPAVRARWCMSRVNARSSSVPMCGERQGMDGIQPSQS